MGVKAENRFKKYNREYFDRQVGPESRGTEILSTQGRIQDLEEALKAEREKNARAMACVKRLRVYLTDARHQTAEARAETKFWHQYAVALVRRFEGRTRAWRKLSRLVRELCTPEEVQRWREENRDADE